MRSRGAKKFCPPWHGHFYKGQSHIFFIIFFYIKIVAPLYPRLIDETISFIDAWLSELADSDTRRPQREVLAASSTSLPVYKDGDTLYRIEDGLKVRGHHAQDTHIQRTSVRPRVTSTTRQGPIQPKVSQLREDVKNISNAGKRYIGDNHKHIWGGSA